MAATFPAASSARLSGVRPARSDAAGGLAARQPAGAGLAHRRDRSWVIVPMVGALVAIICGHMARAQIRESNGTQGGDGMALAGIILGYSHIALTVIGCIVAFVFLGALTAVGA